MNVIHTGPFGVNTMIVPLCDNHVFIVDPACCLFSGDESIITDFLTKNNLTPVAIILTHGHFDHVAGLKILKQTYPQLPVLIHKEDASMIGKDSGLVQGQGLRMMGFEEFIPSVTDLPEPDFYLEDNKTLADLISGLSEELKEAFSRWTVMHTPGHTQGCCCLCNDEEKILISGDTMFYHSWGRTDLPGGNEMQIRKSLLRIAEEVDDDVLVYPGHEYTGFPLEENL